MNPESKLKVQAYFDQELSQEEAREVAAWLERDPEARALFAEFSQISQVLQGNELELKLPESREFYWSKIERQIQRQSGASAPATAALPGWSTWWRRVVAPALGVAILLVAALSLVKLSHAPDRQSYLHEIETPLEDTSTISFHSQTAGMTVVWVQSRVY